MAEHPSAQPSAPPRRLATQLVEARAWTDADLGAYLRAVSESIEHLRPWESWAQAAPSPDEGRAFLDWCAWSWEAGKGFAYGLFAAGGDCVGSAGLAVRDDASHVLSCWVHADRLNRGIATAAAAALTWGSFTVDSVQAVEIHCDVANSVCARIPGRLGYRLEGTEPRAPQGSAEAGRALIWRISRSWYPRTYAHRLWIEEREGGG
ncbi:MAG: GNAT family N-acetyltransferase [Acidimicrobiales bacterium]